MTDITTETKYVPQEGPYMHYTLQSFTKKNQRSSIFDKMWSSSFVLTLVIIIVILIAIIIFLIISTKDKEEDKELKVIPQHIQNLQHVPPHQQIHQQIQQQAQLNKIQQQQQNQQYQQLMMKHQQNQQQPTLIAEYRTHLITSEPP